MSDRAFNENVGGSSPALAQADTNKVTHLLELEYEYLQRCIDRYDHLRFQIRNWAVTASGAVLAYGLSTTRPAVIFAGVIAVFFFAFMELMYMDIETEVISRSNAVESLISAVVLGADRLPDTYRFGIGPTFTGGFRFGRALKRLARRAHIHIFYVGLLMAMLFGVLLTLSAA